MATHAPARGVTKVYVGGSLGRTPDCVALSLEVALAHVEASYVPASEGGGYNLQWVCAFIDGEPDQLRCTATFTRPEDGSGDSECYDLYVESYEIRDTP